MPRAAIGDARPRLMRPPYGDQSLASHLAARRLGLTVVAWSRGRRRLGGRRRPAIAARLLAGLHPGAILLLHDTLASFAEERHRDRGAMLAAVETLLVARPDWRFVTVPELLTRGRPRRRYWIQATDPGYLAGLRFHPDLADLSAAGSARGTSIRRRARVPMSKIIEAEPLQVGRVRSQPSTRYMPPPTGSGRGSAAPAIVPVIVPAAAAAAQGQSQANSPAVPSFRSVRRCCMPSDPLGREPRA